MRVGADSAADTLLRLASRIVDACLRGRVYDVDTDGMPTDPDDIAAMTDATVAIAAELDAGGYTTPGATVEWGSVSIGSVSLSNPLTAGGGDVTVAGVPVPAPALLALADVGAVSVVIL